MRRCFPHIGGQTKTPPEPGFTRRCLHVSTALTIEPPSRFQYTWPDRETHTSWRPSWHLHHLSRCMPSAIPVLRGHYRTAGQSDSTTWRPGLTAGTAGPWWILVPARLSTPTGRPGNAWESMRWFICRSQPRARLRAGERGEVLCWGFLPDGRPPPPSLDTVGVGSAILERARPGRMSRSLVDTACPAQSREAGPLSRRVARGRSPGHRRGGRAPWVPEVLAAETTGAEPFVACAAMAAATRSILVGTGGRRHPRA